MIQKIFSFGEEQGLIRGNYTNPVAGIEFAKEEEKKPEILTITEIRKLLKQAKAVNYPWYPVWAMALLTGCRNGELYAMTFDDIGNKEKAFCSATLWIAFKQALGLESQPGQDVWHP